MKHAQKLILFILVMVLSACSNTHVSSIPVSPQSANSNPSPVSSTAAPEDRTSIIGTWRYIHPQADIMTPNSYFLQFNEDGTVYYMSGWENSESMEYRIGSFSDDEGTLTIRMATIHITEEGRNYDYSDAEYSSIIKYELSGQELHLTLICGNIPFVYMDNNVELIFTSEPKLQSPIFD